MTEGRVPVASPLYSYSKSATTRRSGRVTGVWAGTKRGEEGSFKRIPCWKICGMMSTGFKEQRRGRMFDLREKKMPFFLQFICILIFCI